MKRGIIGLFLVLFALSACQKKDIYDPNYNPDLGVSVPDDFDWSTTKTLTVNVEVNDEYKGKYYYTVRVYDKYPAEGVLPVAASQTVNKNMPFSKEIVIPATVSKLYIAQVFKNADASEMVTLKEANINGEVVNYSFKESRARSVAGRGEAIVLTSGMLIDKNSHYVIQESNTFVIHEISDKVTGVIIDVEGELVFSDVIDLPNNWEINVQDGGKLNASDDLTFGSSSALRNNGEVSISGELKMDNGSTFHNGSTEFGLEGGCLTAKSIVFSGGNGDNKYELGPKSYTSCEELETDKTIKIVMKTGAWLRVTKELDFDDKNSSIEAEGDPIAQSNYVALAQIGQITEGHKANIGKGVLVECTEDNIGGTDIADRVDNAKDKITIVGTTCSGSFGGEEPVGLGGGYYTYIIEDQYPEEGDYDMNDIVVVMSAIQKGNTVYLKGSLVAAGANYRMIPCVLIRNTDIAIPLFEDENDDEMEAYEVLTGSKGAPSPIGTTIDKKCDPRSFEHELEGVPLNLGLDDIDFCILINDQYIHWNTQEGKSTWGMRIPGENFRIPLEGKNIINAYPHFRDWFTNKESDWYNYPESSLVMP